MKQEVTLKLGLSGADFALALGREDARVNRQPAGVNFYELVWPTTLPGTVHFVHGEHSFTVGAVLSIMGPEDVKRQAQGVEELHINFGVTAADLITHEEARLKVMALLKHLQGLGWKQYYWPDQARIKGRSSLMTGETSPTIDARYVPTLEEWKRVDVSWKLEANGVYMDLDMQRDTVNVKHPEVEGAYLLSISLKTEEDMMRLWFEERERDNWKALLPAALKRDHQERDKQEAAARAKGLEIDTQYQDPPILALRGASLSSRVGEPCPKDGIWEARLPANHPEARHLASISNRFKQVKAGQAMPEMYASFMFKTADADNAAVVWSWVRQG